jgi:hypothetical protein
LVPPVMTDVPTVIPPASPQLAVSPILPALS